MGGAQVPRDDDQLAVAGTVLIGGEFHGVATMRSAIVSKTAPCRPALPPHRATAGWRWPR
jgi:hypothetical protein